jgi:hypothetical protein
MRLCQDKANHEFRTCSVFVNDKDELRQIADPDKGWVYHVHGTHITMDSHKYSERMNRRRGEALNGNVPRRSLRARGLLWRDEDR